MTVKAYVNIGAKVIRKGAADNGENMTLLELGANTKLKRKNMHIKIMSGNQTHPTRTVITEGNTRTYLFPDGKSIPNDGLKKSRLKIRNGKIGHTSPQIDDIEY